MAGQQSRTMQQKTPSSAQTDITPPVFSGISGLSASPNGSLQASWGAATDVGSPPVRYDIFIQAGTSVGLFSSGNRLPVGSYSLSALIFSLPDGSLLRYAQAYFVGVRAVDASNNTETNTVSMSATSVGVTADSCEASLQQVKNLIAAGL